MQRRTFLAGSAAAAMSGIPSRFAIAQPANTRTLRFVPHANLTLLDPIFTTATVTTNHGWAIYDTLFSIDNDFQPRPQMAEGYTVSDDGRTYLIRLRDGLKFHNGEPVRAQDCAASLSRWARRETIGQSMSKFIDTWGVQDDRTVRVTLKQPLPIFMPMLARGGSSVPFIMPEHVAKTDPFKQITETIGSGPFIFVKDAFVPGASVLYVRNPDYVPRSEPASWTSGGKVAHFDRIEWKIIPDSATAAAALQSGEVDWYEWVQADLVPLLRKAPDIRVGTAHRLGINGILRFNHLHPPFNNAAIRQAVMMAVDQADYLAAISGNDPDGTRTCKALFPCGTTDGREIGASAMPGDLAKAKAALQAAGYNGEKVVIINPTDLPPIGPMGDVTNDLLKRLGMNVELAASDWGTVTKRRASREPVDKGGWSITHTLTPSFTIGTPIGNHYIRGLGPTGWFGWYGNAKIEQLTEAWMLAPTAQERAGIADAIQTEAFLTVPSVPLGQFQMYNAYRSNLTGVVEAFGALFWNIRRT
ncbi:MAG: ABC transporter substrate-binding protein [Acetobacteraceae bacterium]